MDGLGRVAAHLPPAFGVPLLDHQRLIRWHSGWPALADDMKTRCGSESRLGSCLAVSYCTSTQFLSFQVEDFIAMHAEVARWQRHQATPTHRPAGREMLASGSGPKWGRPPFEKPGWKWPFRADFEYSSTTPVLKTGEAT